MKKIGIVGLGYVGLPLAVEFAKKYYVIGYDACDQRVSQLSSGDDKTNEIHRSELKAAVNFSITNDPADLEICEIFIIAVPTPIDRSNNPDLRLLKTACKTVGGLVAKGNLIIFESTVYPGATEEVCVPIIEQVSGLTYNEDFYCGYSPERINPGDKKNDLRSIVKVTSGSNEMAAKEVDDLYSSVITAGTWKTNSIIVAEAAKVIENCQRDLNIAFVNELSLIFDKLNIDTEEVLAAAKTKWNFLPFVPGLVGGHCIGVDPYYLTHRAKEFGYEPEVILAGRRLNDNMPSYIARKVIQLMVKNKINVPKSKIGILGVSFKENCPDTRNSKVIDIISELSDWDIEVLIDDPVANVDEALNGLDLKSGKLASPVDALIVAVAHDEYRALTIEALRLMCRGENPVIADVKSIYSKTKLEEAGFTVFRL